MGEKALSVLHIDTERTWRGGQQQAVYLFEKLLERGHHTAFICQPGSELAAYFQRKNLPHFPVLMRGEWDMIAGWKIARLCRRHGFELLHLHSAHAAAIGLWTRLFRRKLKLIAVRRVDFSLNGFFSRWKYNHPNIHKIVCISNKIRDVLLMDGIAPNKIVVVPSGVDLSRFQSVEVPPDFKQRWGINERHLIIGTVAAMVGHKDYPNLLQAAKIVLDRHQDVCFCAVGGGPDEAAVRQMAGNLGLGERFIFAGFQADVGPFFKMFDIFVLASKKEGLGTSILDAQALGLPVVACAAGGIPEIVRHDANGLLVPPGNAPELAAALSELIAQPAKRRNFGENGREFVKKFDIHITAGKNILVYQHVLN